MTTAAGAESLHPEQAQVVQLAPDTVAAQQFPGTGEVKTPNKEIDGGRYIVHVQMSEDDGLIVSFDDTERGGDCNLDRSISMSPRAAAAFFTRYAEYITPDLDFVAGCNQARFANALLTHYFASYSPDEIE